MVSNLYHLSCRDIAATVLQLTPPGILVRRETERTTPLAATAATTRIYLALQPVRRTADDVAITTGALLPHLFTRSL